MAWSVVLVALKWMAAHPAEVVMALGFMASCLQKPLARWSWSAKLGRILTAVGVNGPALKAELIKWEPILVQEAEKAVEKRVQ